MSRTPRASAHNTETDRLPSTSPAMIRLVCFLQPGEYAHRFERQLTRSDVVVLRARHELHAYWTIITTEPHALVTDIPPTRLHNDYLLDRLQRNPKTCRLPVLVLTATSGNGLPITKAIHPNVQLLEVTTPTQMAEQVLHWVESQGADCDLREERLLRADTSGGGMITPRRRTDPGITGPTTVLVTPRRVQDRSVAPADPA